jgi:putative transposase
VNTTTSPSAGALPTKVAFSKSVNSIEGVTARRLCQEHDPHVRKYPWGGHFWDWLLLRRHMPRGTPERGQAKHRKPATPGPTTTRPAPRDRNDRDAPHPHPQARSTAQD